MNDDHVKILKNRIDLDGIISEVDDILHHFKSEGHDLPHIDQISLQAPVKSTSIGKHWNCSVGKLKDLDGQEEKYVFPIFKKAELINHYLESFNIYRARLMISYPKECYTVHRDNTPRIHIPVVSDPRCLMVIGSSAYYLDPGKVYWTDTTRPHTALNGSDDWRIHIVGCVK